MNYSRWLKDYQELTIKLEEEEQHQVTEQEDSRDEIKVPSTEIELSDIGRCLACWFFDCRCAAGLANK